MRKLAIFAGLMLCSLSIHAGAPGDDPEHTPHAEGGCLMTTREARAMAERSASAAGGIGAGLCRTPRCAQCLHLWAVFPKGRGLVCVAAQGHG